MAELYSMGRYSVVCMAPLGAEKYWRAAWGCGVNRAPRRARPLRVGGWDTHSRAERANEHFLLQKAVLVDC